MTLRTFSRGWAENSYSPGLKSFLGQVMYPLCVSLSILWNGKNNYNNIIIQKIISYIENK